MSKPRTFELGTLEGGAKDGGDIFTVLNFEPRITFREMLDGVHVIEKSAYDKAIEKLKWVFEHGSIGPRDKLRNQTEQILKELGEIK